MKTVLIALLPTALIAIAVMIVVPRKDRGTRGSNGERK